MPTILFQSAAVAVVDKPAGIPVIPARDPKPDSPCLRALVEQQLERPVWVVHRLDAQTSGAVIFALTAEAHRRLCHAFMFRQVQKRYLALVTGKPPEPEGEIAIPLHTARRGKMRPALPSEQNALPSLTKYQTLFAAPGVTLLAVYPVTGRQHQIRVHLRAIGCPVAGDSLYGVGESRRIGRLMLHHQRVIFPAVEESLHLTVNSPPPEDFEAILRRHEIDPAASQSDPRPFHLDPQPFHEQMPNE